MNAEKPILVLQMQRMGDLVLSYPLVSWLIASFPGSEIWIVGEKTFFNGLLEISPAVTYFDYAEADALKQREYKLILNLSHRREAAELAGRLKTERLLGPYTDKQDRLRVNGRWQLYRASINNNNRHNLFHWADLNALDTTNLRSIMRTAWPPVKSITAGDKKRVALFVGASEPDKRPEAAFWARLAVRLMNDGNRPVFLGGKIDAGIASRAAALIKAPALNLCGHFSIPELCRFMRGLDLLIVPDTGPMHIAAWLGVPILNISIGPVNAWETAPFSPGHYVLRPALSCAGCWSCTQPEPWCKKYTSADKVADIASRLLAGKANELSELPLPGKHLFLTGRDRLGLFDLQPVSTIRKEHLQRSRFWKYFFGAALGAFPNDEESSARLAEFSLALQEDGLSEKIKKYGNLLLKHLLEAATNPEKSALQCPDFWLDFPPLLRPLSSYAQLLVQNELFSRPSVLQGINLVERFMNQFKTN